MRSPGATVPARDRLGADTLPVTWLAAVFALLAGTTMAFVPYEFEALLFRHIYRHVQLLGLGFLVAGFALTTAAAYSRTRLPGLLGRLTFVACVSPYWWLVTVRAGGAAGMVVYPLFAAAVVAEAWPRWRRGGLLPWFLIAVSLGIGAAMIAVPARFPVHVFDHRISALRACGAGFVLGAAALSVARRFRRDLERWAFALPMVLFGALAYTMVPGRSWVGLELYLVLAIGCAAVATAPSALHSGRVRTRLLRSMAVACLVPLFAVGGITSLLAQRQIEKTLRERMQQTVLAEEQWLRETIDQARLELELLGQDERLTDAVARDDRAAARAVLRRFLEHDRTFRDLVVVGNGEAPDIAATDAASIPMALRAAAGRAPLAEDGRTSSSYRDAAGVPTVALQVPVQPPTRKAVKLIGALALTAIEHRAPAMTPYRVRVLDRVDGRVLSDSSGGELLRRVGFPPDALADLTANDSGTLRVFDEDGAQRLLLAHVAVAGTTWTMVVSQELSAALAPVTGISVVVAVLVLLAGALALVLSHLLGNELVTSIGVVRDAARTLAEGDLKVRVGNAEGAPEELATLARDFDHMAERLEADQAELARVNEALRRALDETEQLTASLKRADRRKDEFLAMVAHELRNPLAAISAAVSLLEIRPEAALPKRDLRPVFRRQLDHLVRIVDDLLDVSRITQGKVELRRQVIDLVEVVRNAVEMVRPSIASKGHTISVALPDGQLPMDGDPTRLEQIVSNLLGNAIKYTDPGGLVAVRVHRDEQAAGGGAAVIQVRDNGNGISAEVLPHVFDLFVQGDTPIHRREAGLGLGLTLVKSLVAMHGGAVAAQSDGLGRGSTFTVTLPLVAAAVATDAPRVIGDVTTPGHKRHIVVIDDNEDAALSLKELLESFGHEVDVAYDGERGRQLIRERRPFLAFVDLGLPTVDGYEVARSVRSDVPATKLVALTGYGGEEVRLRTEAAGFDRHLTKPFRLEELDDLLG